MGVTSVPFGTVDNKEVFLFTLTNKAGMTVKAMNLGCHIMQVWVPDREGVPADVVLSFDTLEEAKNQSSFLGVVAGRVANRIDKSFFELNGKVYHLYVNNGPNHLHGGKIGFDKKVWDAEILEGENAVRFTYFSPDGEENYPGNLTSQVTYTLTEDNGLKIDYHAMSDADTIVNLTNHSYFNLGGHNSGTILDHYLKLNCDKYTAANDELMPTGEIADVAGTPFDFRDFRRVGQSIDDDEPQLIAGGGYDQNFVINHPVGGVELAATLWDKKSGRVMEVYTDKPGVQLYTANLLKDVKGKGGYVYQPRNGLCLETQYFPNSIKLPNFPSPVLKAGDTYSFTTIYRFRTDR